MSLIERINIKPIFRLLLTLIFGLGIFSFLLLKIDLLAVKGAFLTINIGVFLLAFVILSLSFFAASLRWYFLLRMVGHPVSLKKVLVVKMANIPLAKFMPAYSGDYGRVLYMKKEIPATKNAGIVLLESFLDIACLAIFSFFGAIMLGITHYIFISTILFFVVVIAMFMLGRISLGRLASRPKFAQLVEVFSILRVNPNYWLIIIISTFFTWIVAVIFVSLTFIALGHHISLLTIFAVQPLVTLMSLLPITIGGLGIREGGMLLLYANSAPASVILSVGLLYSFASIIIFPAIGTVFFFLRRVD